VTLSDEQSLVKKVKIMRLHLTLGLCVSLFQISTIPAQAIKTGPAVGQQVPDFSAQDQANRTQTLKSVMGPKGVMLVFFRSADW
jgi:hypothetical protein